MSPREREPIEVDEGLEEGADDAVIGRAFRWSLVVIAALLLIGVGTAIYLNRPVPAVPVRTTEYVPPKTREIQGVEIPKLPFRDVTEAAGIKFKHHNGARGEKLLPETMGSGCAFLDFDNDGDQDVLFVNACDWPWSQSGEKPPTQVLYRNNGKGEFEDATAGSGIDVTCYGTGVAVGDFDNDGWVDVFLSTVGPNRLFRNEEGKFREVTADAGVAGEPQSWSTGAAFVDYDNDGDLDLFVANYVRWSREIDSSQGFQLVGVGRAYGPPLAFEGSYPYLYRNDGQGKFTDVSAESGIQVKNANTGVPVAKSLGIAPIDLEADGRIDLIVANDTVQNFVYHNLGGGKFEEVGAVVGMAFDSNGNARGAMGIDTGYFRNDHSLAVAIGNFANEMTALYVSQEDPLQFVDAAIATGLGPPSRLELKFGVFFFDVDLDGRLDLLQANGHLEDEINKVQVTQHYEQPPQLFWNCGAGRPSEFILVPSEKVGEEFHKPMVGRGAAYADIDADGDLDALLTASGGSPRLLKNEQGAGHHWLRFKLIGKTCNRDAIGAWVEVHADLDGHPAVLRRQVMPTRSYLSQVELPVTFGLGKTDRIQRVFIRWPDGTGQEIASPEVDRLHVVEQQPNVEAKGAGS